MIYLIDDDRRDQQKEYFAEYLRQGKYNTLITPVYKLTAETDLTYLEKARCILIHQSFPDFSDGGDAITGKASVYEKVLAIGQRQPVPMVVFSNGFLESYSPTWTPTFIDLMNKRLLYSNLQDFISHFSKTGQIELKVLTYGKYFIAREIEDIFDQLTNLMSSAQNLKSNLTEVKELARKFANIADADNAVKVLLAMENIEGFPTPPFLNELEKILKSFFKYGRNIYH